MLGVALPERVAWSGGLAGYLIGLTGQIDLERMDERCKNP